MGQGGESGASRLRVWAWGAQNVNGYTALHNAANKGHLEMARLLLVSGADRAAKTTRWSGEKTARDHAVRYNHPAVAALLR